MPRQPSPLLPRLALPRAPGRAACAAIVLLAAWATGAGAAEALFRLDGEIGLERRARALAVNADESVLAAATEPDILAETAPVRLFDRRSRSPLGSIEAATGPVEGVRFAPLRDRLLVWGPRALELWRTDLSSLSTGAPLDDGHRLWRQPLDEGPPVDSAGFAGPGHAVHYSRGGTLHREAAATPRAGSEGPVWEVWEADHADTAFAYWPGGDRIAAWRTGGKRIHWLASPSLEPQGLLEGHRFGIRAAGFAPGGRLISLDEQGHLLRWAGLGPPEAERFLEHPPAGARPVGVRPRSAELLFLPATGEGGRRLLALTGWQSRVWGELELPAEGPLAISPTGRYIAVGDGRTLRLFRFAEPVSPAEYVRRLMAAGAHAAAATYVRMLDPEGLPPGARAAAEAELERTPAQEALAGLLQQLRRSLQRGNVGAIEEWARRVLALDPDNAEAERALTRLIRQRQAEVVQRARQAYADGEYREAIDLLTGIPEASPHYPEARALIRRAEAQRTVESTLAQAREKLDMGLVQAADSLVREALRQQPGHPRALALQKRIDSRREGYWRQVGFYGGGALLAVLIAGLMAWRFRRPLIAMLRPFALEQRSHPRGLFTREVPEAPPSPGRQRVRPQPRRPAGPQPAPPRPGREAPIGREEQRHAVRHLLDKTEEMVRLARQADVAGEHSAFLLEVEAEVNTLSRRLHDPGAELRGLGDRLLGLQRELRGLRFSPRSARRDAGEEAGEDYYSLLRVPFGASQEEIQQAYHQLIKEYHPDRHSHSEFGWIRAEAERMSRRLGEAYAVLSDGAKRQRYDRELLKRRRAAE